MIPIDLSLFASIFTSALLLLVLGRWIIYTYSSSHSVIFESKKEDLIICPYCTHLFFDFEKEKVKVCPRCESYIAAEEPKEKH